MAVVVFSNHVMIVFGVEVFYLRERLPLRIGQQFLFRLALGSFSFPPLQGGVPSEDR